MSTPSITHNTFVIERTYPVRSSRVFAAFSDPAQKRRWFAEGEEFMMEEYSLDFQVGGIERARFRSKQGVTYQNDSVYVDIVPEKRIAIAYAMSQGDKRFSASLATFEFLEAGDETTLIFTEQGAYFEGADGPQFRQAGWNQLLGALAKELSR